MKRVGFLLKVKEGMLEEYKEHHRAVWPDMLDALARNGWHNYSLFMREDGMLFGYFEAEESLAASVAGMERTMGAVITIGAGCYEPGRVVRTDSNALGFKVGELDGSDSKRAHELASIMNHVENTEVTTDLMGERWSKLIINNMNNAIAGLTGLGAAEVRTNSEPRRVSIHLGAETAQVAQACGHKLQPVMGVTADSLIDAVNGKNVEETETAIMESARLVAGGRPSFGQDVLKGRSTEIDDLNGYVSRKGREVGIPTPFNDRIVEIVHELGIGFKPRPENLQPLVDMLDGG